MRKTRIVLTAFLILSIVPSYAVADLVLIKLPQNIFWNTRGCYARYNVPLNQDVPDMREFRYFLCDGVYNMTLDGPPGNVVTFFGAFDFKREYGYLIIKKTDDKQVWILDLEKFPVGKWHKVEAKGEYGGYEAFYHASSGFESNIASVKWGEWWGNEDLQK